MTGRSHPLCPLGPPLERLSCVGGVAGEFIGRTVLNHSEKGFEGVGAGMLVPLPGRAMVSEWRNWVKPRAICQTSGVNYRIRDGARKHAAESVKNAGSARAGYAPLIRTTLMPLSMPISHSDTATAGALSLRSERACATLIEERWRRASGISLRLTDSAAGVVERPGRTRFDLQWHLRENQFCGPLRCNWPDLPLADESLQLVVIERLGFVSREQLEALLMEACRVLDKDGRLLVVDTNPWGWLGLRARLSGVAFAPSAAGLTRLLMRLGLEDIEVEHALRLPPCPRPILERHGDRIEAICNRVLAIPGSIYAVSGRKRSSNVIAIPLQRDRRPSLIAVPEGMRRAG